jgi:ribosome-associated protein
LEQLSLLVNRKPNKSVRLAKNSKIIKAIIQAIQEKKGEKIITLDLRKIQEAVADFFIVCEAGSTTQVRAIADFIESEVKDKCGEMPYMHEGRQVLQWVIIDYINVVVHIMLPESRRFYKLEEMWSDAVLEEHEG